MILQVHCALFQQSHPHYFSNLIRIISAISSAYFSNLIRIFQQSHPHISAISSVYFSNLIRINTCEKIFRGERVKKTKGEYFLKILVTTHFSYRAHLKILNGVASKEEHKRTLQRGFKRNHGKEDRQARG